MLHLLAQGVRRFVAGRNSGLRLLSLCLPALLAACTIPVVETLPQDMCNFQRYRLEVELPEAPGHAALDGVDRPLTVARAIRNLFKDTAPGPGAAPTVPQDDAMLFLSGGSQEGAFGAGILNRWHLRAGHLPAFRVVTGISTGAILATPAFLDRPELSVDHRTSPTDEGHHGYAVLGESELLRPIARSGARGFGVRTAIPALRHGAVADLDPLRQMLLRELGDAELNAVAAAYGRRLLLVGVVDVDSGQAVALDLTEMAHRYAGAREPEKTRLHHCYVDAIVASSSEPLAALPVFIDNRMYVDGGARFGLFSSEFDRAFADIAKNPTTEEAAVERRLALANVYAIVNGDLTTPETCGRQDRSLCQTVGTDGRYGAHAGWNLLDLALRSERILVNQVQRMSLARINSKEESVRFHPAWIQSQGRTHLFRMDHPGLGSGQLTCAEWRAMDTDLVHPIQFHPREMHCLIDYGGWEFDQNLRWNQPPAPPNDIAVPTAKP